MSEELSEPLEDPPGLELDLAASELRADRTDTHALIEALAVRLEEALPRLATVKRSRVGGFRSKQTEVQRIDVSLDEQRFELEQTRSGLQCTRHTVVRGITLKREELPLPDWIRDLVAEVTRAASVGEKARTVLESLVR
ncbi:MAG TPA: hypothetical protein VID68_03175 [Solirubrobacteraceae bacterium]|jgi:hypothetical protein